VILLLSVSQVTRITDVIYQAELALIPFPIPVPVFCPQHCSFQAFTTVIHFF
jgi:hypothetical protein